MFNNGPGSTDVLCEKLPDVFYDILQVHYPEPVLRYVLEGQGMVQVLEGPVERIDGRADISDDLGVGCRVAGFENIDQALQGRDRRPEVMGDDMDEILEFVVLAQDTEPGVLEYRNVLCGPRYPDGPVIIIMGPSPLVYKADAAVAQYDTCLLYTS